MLLCFYGVFTQIDPLDINVSLSLVQNTADDVHRRGLTGSVRSHKTHNAVTTDFEIHIFYRPLRSVAMRQMHDSYD